MPPSPSRRAIVALLIVTLIWGWTFSWMKAAIEAAEAAVGEGALVLVIGLFMCLRFAIGAVGLPLVMPAARRGLWDRGVWIDGLWLALLLLGGFLLQMFGLHGVSPAVSAFLTSLYVVFTALWTRVARRSKLGWAVVLGVGLVSLGAAFISGPPQLHFDLPEWLTVLCAVLFAAHIVATDTITKRRPPMAISVSSFSWVVLGSLAVLLLGVQLRPDIGWAGVLTLLRTPAFMVPVGLSGALGTGVALTLLNAYQRELSPVRAAILYSLEPIWAALIAVAVGLMSVDPWLLIGGSGLLVGNLIVEVVPRIQARMGDGSARSGVK
jgi:drug/metabolite transporter (DMT)-like permease